MLSGKCQITAYYCSLMTWLAIVEITERVLVIDAGKLIYGY